MHFRRVIIESPWAGLAVNEAYLSACIRDCIQRGETPYASHRMLIPALRDDIPEERALGLEAGRCWYECAELVAVYVDLGISPGMQTGIAYAQAIPGMGIVHRSLEKWSKEFGSR